MVPTDIVMEGEVVTTTLPVQPTTTQRTAFTPTLRVRSLTVPRSHNRAQCAHRDRQAQGRDMDALRMAILPEGCRRSRDHEPVSKSPRLGSLV